MGEVLAEVVVAAVAAVAADKGARFRSGVARARDEIDIDDRRSLQKTWGCGDLGMPLPTADCGCAALGNAK